MTDKDQLYFELCCKLGLVRSPLLEVGSAKVQGIMPSLCDLAHQYQIAVTVGVDLQPGNGVDLVADFSIAPDKFERQWSYGTFATVGVFNVLEHTFDPVTVLRNALHCVAQGGTLLVVTPAVWPLHNFPRDHVRLMPNWYEAFADKYGLTLSRDAFCWLSQFGMVKVGDLLVKGEYQLPMFLNSGRAQNPRRYWMSRFTHKVLDTYGRSHSFTHAAIGAVFIVPT